MKSSCSTLEAVLTPVRSSSRTGASGVVMAGFSWISIGLPRDVVVLRIRLEPLSQALGPGYLGRRDLPFLREAVREDAGSPAVEEVCYTSKRPVPQPPLSRIPSVISFEIAR